MTRFRKIKRFILDILYPNRCPLCEKIIRYDKLVCDDCKKAIVSTDDFCKRCGFKKCDCANKKYYDSALSVGVYEGRLRSALLRLKTLRNDELSEFFAESISEKLGDTKLDAIVFVPMTAERKRKSGFNQSCHLAKALSNDLNLPLIKNALVKVKDYKHHELTGAQREVEVKGAYIKGKADVSGKRVALVDDIVTTGSTMNECARLLKEMGAKSVTALFVAKTADDFI
ncbi:MAG: ComF family protein [Ruminococcus sp.]|nr:ComF family protein [Ruminococcus sp.]